MSISLVLHATVLVQTVTRVENCSAVAFDDAAWPPQAQLVDDIWISGQMISSDLPL